MKNNYLKVLLIEDDRVDQLAFKRFVDQSGLKYDYEVVSSFREAKSILTEKKFDVVITDYFLGDGTAFDVFNHVADSTVIITTGTGDEEIAVRAMKTGAYDYLIKDPDRNYLTVLPVTVENALKQKKADDNKKRLRLLESAVHHAFDPVIIVKHSSAGIENTEIVYVNKIFTKVTGYQPAEVMGKSPEFLFAKEIDENEIKNIQNSFKHEKSFSSELNFVRKDGSRFWVEFSMQPVANGLPENSHWILVQRDITERKISEKKLRHNNKQLEVILQSMGDGVIVIDSAQKIIVINNKAKELLGNAKTNMKNFQLGEVLKNCWNGGRNLINALNQDSFSNFELKVMEPIPRILLVTSTTFLEMAGQSDGKVLVLRDFTREKEIDRMKTDFVSNVSFELRTPLASILGFSGTILKDKEMPPETRDEFNEIIFKESTRLAKLIEDILSISRIESGCSIYEPREMEIRPVMQDVHNSFKEKALKKGINLINNLNGDALQMHADPKAIRQVMVKLVGNAIKATGKGGSVITSAERKNNKIILKVSDTGIGIPQKDITRIFDKFYRVYRDGQPLSGTGLGLSIVKEIVDFHKGEVKVESKENKGTTFRIILPVN